MRALHEDLVPRDSKKYVGMLVNAFIAKNIFSFDVSQIERSAQFLDGIYCHVCTCVLCA